MPTFTATQTHAGQYRRYGDIYNEWVVLTDAGEAEAVEWCLAHLCGKSIPNEHDFRKGAEPGGDKWGDPAYYFAGYYSLRKIQGGYHFTRVLPYCD